MSKKKHKEKKVEFKAETEKVVFEEPPKKVVKEVKEKAKPRKLVCNFIY